MPASPVFFMKFLIGKKLGVDFKKTFSCYVGKEKHCGFCLACKLRQAGFHWAGVEDVTEYFERII